METSYFGYFGHAWVRTLRVISIHRKLHCFSGCQKTSSFNFSLSYYILKNPEIWFINRNQPKVWELDIFQICDWWWNINNNNNNFYFKLFPGRFFRTPKTPSFWAILPVFAEIWQKMKFSRKKFVPFFKYSCYVQSYKKSGKKRFYSILKGIIES